MVDNGQSKEQFDRRTSSRKRLLVRARAGLQASMRPAAVPGRSVVAAAVVMRPSDLITDVRDSKLLTAAARKGCFTKSRIGLKPLCEIVPRE